LASGFGILRLLVENLRRLYPAEIFNNLKLHDRPYLNGTSQGLGQLRGYPTVCLNLSKYILTIAIKLVYFYNVTFE